MKKQDDELSVTHVHERLGEPLVSMLSGIAFGVAGFGYWSLAAMQIVSAVVATVSTWWWCRWRPGWPKVAKGAREMIAFGRNLTGFTDLIVILLGEKWMAAGEIFRWLGLLVFMQPVANATGWLFITQNRTGETLRWGLVGSTLSVIAIVSGLPWGPPAWRWPTPAAAWRCALRCCSSPCTKARPKARDGLPKWGAEAAWSQPAGWRAQRLGAEVRNERDRAVSETYPFALHPTHTNSLPPSNKVVTTLIRTPLEIGSRTDMRVWTLPFLASLWLVAMPAAVVEPPAPGNAVMRIGRDDVVQRAAQRGPGMLTARTGKASAARIRKAADSVLSLPPRVEIGVARHKYPGGAGMDVTAALWQDFSLGGLGAAKQDVAKSHADVRGLKVELARRQAIHAAMLAWIDAWHRRSLLSLRRRSAVLAEQLVGIAESRLKAGADPPVELALAKSVLGSARASLIDVRGRVEEADARLRHALGLPPDVRIDIEGAKR